MPWWGEITNKTTGRWLTGRPGRQAYFVRGGEVFIPASEFAIMFTIFGSKVTEIGFINFNPEPQSLIIKEGLYSKDGLQWHVTIKLQIRAIDSPECLARIPVEGNGILEFLQIGMKNYLATIFRELDNVAASAFASSDHHAFIAGAKNDVADTPYELVAASITHVLPADPEAFRLVESRRKAKLSDEARQAEHRGTAQRAKDAGELKRYEDESRREYENIELEHRQAIEHKEAVFRQKLTEKDIEIASQERLSQLRFKTLEITLLARANAIAERTISLGKRKDIEENNRIEYDRLLKASILPKALQRRLAIGVDGVIELKRFDKEIAIAQSKADHQRTMELVKLGFSGAAISAKTETFEAILKNRGVLPTDFSVRLDTSSLLNTFATAEVASESLPNSMNDDEGDAGNVK